MPPVDTPVCECHGVAKVWSVDANRKAGGCWRCAVKRRDSQRRWDQSPSGRARKKQYAQLPHVRAAANQRWREKYASDPDFRELRLALSRFQELTRIRIRY